MGLRTLLSEINNLEIDINHIEKMVNQVEDPEVESKLELLTNPKTWQRDPIMLEDLITITNEDIQETLIAMLLGIKDTLQEDLEEKENKLKLVETELEKVNKKETKKKTLGFLGDF